MNTALLNTDCFFISFAVHPDPCPHHPHVYLVSLMFMISTQREVDRRQMMLDNLKTKEKQMEAAFRHDNSDTRSVPHSVNIAANGSYIRNCPACEPFTALFVHCKMECHVVFVDTLIFSHICVISPM